jgi:trimethylamine:corrinoid methyltransferase-like protein
VRSAYHASPIFPHYPLEKWEELGRPTAEARLRAATVDLLHSAPAPEDQPDVLALGEAWIAAFAGSASMGSE